MISPAGVATIAESVTVGGDGIAELSGSHPRMMMSF
jgi:hypothetical protein